MQQGITLTFGHLNNNQFIETVVKMANQDGFADFKESYNAAKILRRIQSELKLAREQHLKLLEKYAQRDEHNRFKKKEVKSPTDFPFEIKDGLNEEYEERMKEFLATEISLDCTPLHAEKMGAVKLSPIELNTISVLFAEDFEPTSDVSSESGD